MSRWRLKYVGKHMPLGVYEVEEELAKDLLKTKEWKKLVPKKIIPLK